MPLGVSLLDDREQLDDPHPADDLHAPPPAHPETQRPDCDPATISEAGDRAKKGPGGGAARGPEGRAETGAGASPAPGPAEVSLFVRILPTRPPRFFSPRPMPARPCPCARTDRDDAVDLVRAGHPLADVAACLRRQPAEIEVWCGEVGLRPAAGVPACP